MVMESYFYTHKPMKNPKRKNVRRVGEYDPNADEKDIRYTDNYGM